MENRRKLEVIRVILEQATYLFNNYSTVNKFGMIVKQRDVGNEIMMSFLWIISVIKHRNPGH